VNNVFAVQQIYGGETIRLAHLALGQRLFGGKLDVVAGRLMALDDFVASPLYCDSQNAALCGNPFNLTANAALSAYPFAQWGARATVKPLDGFTIMTGVYDAYANFRANGYHGVNFSIPSSSGVIWMNELDLQPERITTLRFTDMPGHYKLGGYFDNEPLTEFSSGEQERGTYSLYLAFDQMLYQVSGPLGLTAFVTLHYAPPDVNPFVWFADAGAVYQGLFPSRPNDLAGIYVAYGRFSGDLHDRQLAAGQPAQSYEVVLEVNYAFNVLPWLNLQPDIQGILHPGGAGDTPDALVLGLQAAIPF